MLEREDGFTQRAWKEDKEDRQSAGGGLMRLSVRW